MVSMESNKRSKSKEWSEPRSLPEDILMDILSRLPAPAIGRLRCVCKRWLHLLSKHNAHFMDLHTRRALSNPLFLFTDKLTVRHPGNLSGPDPVVRTHGYFRLFHAARRGSQLKLDNNDYHPVFLRDGLPIYRSIVCRNLVFLLSEHKVYVCNPSTRETTDLNYYYDSLRFCGFGVGFVPVRGEYKLVHLFRNGYGRLDFSIRARVLSLREGLPPRPYSPIPWKALGACPYEGVIGPQSLCIDQFIYWIVLEEDRPSKILSFDLETEGFGLFPCPCKIESDVSMIEWRGSLCLARSQSDAGTIDLWVLNCDFTESTSLWVKAHSIDVLDVKGGELRDFQVLAYIPPKSLGHGGELLIKCCKIKRRGRQKRLFLCYNCLSKRVETVHAVKLEDQNGPYFYFSGFFSLGASDQETAAVGSIICKQSLDSLITSMIQAMCLVLRFLLAIVFAPMVTPNGRPV